MVNVQTHFTGRIIRISVTRAGSTLLAGKAVPFEDIISQLWRNASFDRRGSFDTYKNVFTRLQVVPVDMGMNLHTLLIPQFADPPGIFRNGRHFPNLMSRNNLADIGFKKRTDAIFSGHLTP